MNEETAVVEEVRSSKKLSMTEEIAKLREGFQACRDELDQMRAIQDNAPPIDPQPSPAGVEMILYGPVCCPECDFLLEGYSATGERTRYYKHPFAQSPKLSGAACQYKGMLFEPPKIILKPVPQQSKRS